MCLVEQANAYVRQLHWVADVDVTMDAVTPQAAAPQADRPGGLKNVAHIIAVSSCKGGSLPLRTKSLCMMQTALDVRAALARSHDNNISMPEQDRSRPLHGKQTWRSCSPVCVPSM